MTRHVISAKFARREQWRHGDPIEQYVWNIRYVDAPVLRWHDGDTDGTVDDTLYVMNDANFNVTGLVNAATGDVVERYIFTPYGERTVLDADWDPVSGNESAYAFTLGHQGLWLDVESVLYYVRNRMYDPTLGRWLQRDPGGYVDGMSLYQYVTGRPVTELDPLGLGLYSVTDEQAALVNKAVTALKTTKAARTQIGQLVIERIEEIRRGGRIGFVDHIMDDSIAKYDPTSDSILVNEPKLTANPWRVPEVFAHEGIHAVRRTGARGGKTPREEEYEATLMGYVVSAELNGESLLKGLPEGRGLFRAEPWVFDLDDSRIMHSWQWIRRRVDSVYRESPLAGKTYKWLEGIEELKNVARELHRSATHQTLRGLYADWYSYMYLSRTGKGFPRRFEAVGVDLINLVGTGDWDEEFDFEASEKALQEQAMKQMRENARRKRAALNLQEFENGTTP